MNLQHIVFPTFLAVTSVCLAGASCDKKSSASAQEASEIIAALDKTEPAAVKPGQSGAQGLAKGPIPGVNLSNLDEAKKQTFDKLADSLASPCGKAHSLRQSALTDDTCKRARYAARYVVALLEDEADADDVREYYKAKYGAVATPSLTLDGVPRSGPEDARVVLVEFFDFGCPACKALDPVFTELVAQHPDDVVLYYKQFPLASHPDSGPAAQAALAAHKQGKYLPMHKLLIAEGAGHKVSDLRGYARQIGLDMTKFDADYKAAKVDVDFDQKEGNDAGVMGTPTLFFNGREYKASFHPRYMNMWIEEERAVNE